jgi:hypothetical protein
MNVHTYRLFARELCATTGQADQYASMISNKVGGALGNTCAWAAFLGNVGTESAGLTEWTQCVSSFTAPSSSSHSPHISSSSLRLRQ